MRNLLSGLCCVVFAAAVFAGDARKPNTLTDKEIRDGWILLFDGETTFGWDGKASVKKGRLVLDVSAAFTTRFPKSEVLWEGANRIGTTIPANSSVQFPRKSAKVGVFQAVKLRPLGMKPIFNGKNLDGWKVLPGYKSKYTVTKEGWLNVKNGRGDIQTTDIFKDFVLQFECISHGKHLNSGIFFRCIPGLYQQGYEAQIRNQATPGKPRAYVLDRYSPKTHNKSGKYKVMSEAFDYGTGGIYRRMPARKVVSKDNEWFTMTIVAHGNHIATWVNGVQVTDWTDNRPRSKNARQGSCLSAGAISIQGHDPTTNLSFRNFKIAEIPKK